MSEMEVSDTHLSIRLATCACAEGRSASSASTSALIAPLVSAEREHLAFEKDLTATCLPVLECLALTIIENAPEAIGPSVV